MHRTGLQEHRAADATVFLEDVLERLLDPPREGARPGELAASRSCASGSLRAGAGTMMVAPPEVIFFGYRPREGHWWWLSLENWKSELDVHEFNPDVPVLLRYTDGVDAQECRGDAHRRAYEIQERGKATTRQRIPLLPEHSGQGSAKLTIHEGWTYLGWWDYAGDKRPGSNSGVLAKGEKSFEEMVALARGAFPVERVAGLREIPSL